MALFDTVCCTFGFVDAVEKRNLSRTPRLKSFSFICGSVNVLLSNWNVCLFDSLVDAEVLAGCKLFFKIEARTFHSPEVSH